MYDTKVVAISGVSGAGKTTIVKQLATEYCCPFLLFDDYVDKETYPLNMKSWLNEGANVSLIKTAKFACELKALRANNSHRFIFIEEPFGKERNAMSPLIDYVILLAPPMELCLARIIKRHTQKPTTGTVSAISNYLNKYQDHLRDVYITAATQVSNNADLIVKEVVSIDDTSRYISNWLKTN